MDTELISHFGEIIEEKGLDYDEYLNLYNEGRNQELFEKTIQQDLVEIVEWLYLNKEVKFYLKQYLSTGIDKDLLEELNSENTGKCYKVQYSKGEKESYKVLLEYRKYSKLNRDEKGFYYTYKKRG